MYKLFRCVYCQGYVLELTNLRCIGTDAAPHAPVQMVLASAQRSALPLVCNRNDCNVTRTTANSLTCFIIGHGRMKLDASRVRVVNIR